MRAVHKILPDEQIERAKNEQQTGKRNKNTGKPVRLHRTSGRAGVFYNFYGYGIGTRHRYRRGHGQSGGERPDMAGCKEQI